MNNTTLFALNFTKFDIDPAIWVMGDIHSRWVFSWNNYIIGGLFLLLVVWNIYLTIKTSQNRSSRKSGGKN